MLKFGAVTIDVSHPSAFADKLLEGERARYTAVFNDGFRSEEEVLAFSEKYGAKIYKDLDEMIDNVDLGLVHCCNWDKHLDYIMHFVRKGKPVFVDKPIVGNLKDVKKLLELSKEGARILGTSALRYTYEIDEIKEKLKAEGASPIFVSTTVGLDEFNYAVHGVEHIAGIVDSRPISCRYVGSFQVETDAKGESYYINYESGASAMFSIITSKPQRFHTTVITNKGSAGDYCYTVDNYKFYQAMLDRVCDEMEGKPGRLATIEEMVYPILILLAGKASREAGGIEVALDSPLLENVSFDGYEFERGYSEAARKAAAKK